MSSMLNYLSQLLPRQNCLLPYYHMVSDDWVPHVSTIYGFRNIRQFRDDLDTMLAGRQALTLQEFLSSVHLTGAPPPRSMLLSFDDGFREMHDVVMPILMEKGVPAVFFLSSGFVDNLDMCFHQKIALVLDHRRRMKNEFPGGDVRKILMENSVPGEDVTAGLRSIQWHQKELLDQCAAVCGLDFSSYAQKCRPYLNTPQIHRMVRNGFDIGAHGIDHPRFAVIAREQQLYQTRESIRYVLQTFGVELRAFAFPHTDEGVSADFFYTLFGEGTLDVSFGTSGPREDSMKLNFQRFSMEKSGQNATVILTKHWMRGMKRRVAGTLVATRS